MGVGLNVTTYLSPLDAWTPILILMATEMPIVPSWQAQKYAL